MNPNHVLTIKTTQIAPFHKMITANKEIITSDANIIFTPEGMIMSNDNVDVESNAQQSTSTTCLFAKEFEEFHCVPQKIIICLNTQHFFKMITQITNDDQLTLFISNENYNDGIVSSLGIQFENEKLHQVHTHHLRLLDPEYNYKYVPPVLNYSSVIRMSSSYFQKIIRDANTVYERIIIQTVGNELIFLFDGMFCDGKIIRTESQDHDSLVFLRKADASVVNHGEFSLKILYNFIKCTPLCPHMELYLENNMPLILKYDVACLGFIELKCNQLPSSM
jgi:proliferating cell nuclear antigen